MFNVYTKNISSSESLLDEGKISAYVIFDEELKMVVRESGINQSVIKMVLESFSRTNNMIVQILSEDTSLTIENLDIPSLSSTGSFTTYSENMSTQPDMALNYFYALIAMSCLFASTYGLSEITNIQANLSVTAARVNMSGVPKYKFVVASLLAAFTVQVILCFLLIAFLMFVLKIDFGDRVMYVLMTCLSGCLFGLFLGAFIGASSSKNEDFKSSLITAFSLGCCFLSGLMIPTIKYFIESYVPFFRYINPANLITDSLYSLYYYDTLDRFYINIIILSGFTLILAILTCFLTRRSKYASL
jgi:ABC-2 type transport system permease protein